MPLVKIVESNGRLRVKPYRKDGWVRFPRHLRIKGAVYWVDELRFCEIKNNEPFYIACGEIWQKTWKKCSRKK